MKHLMIGSCTPSAPISKSSSRRSLVNGSADGWSFDQRMWCGIAGTGCAAARVGCSTGKEATVPNRWPRGWDTIVWYYDVFIYIYTYIYTYRYTYIITYIHFVCIYTYTHIYTHIHVYTHIHTYTRTHIQTYMHAYIYIYIYTYIHIYIYTYICHNLLSTYIMIYYVWLSWYLWDILTYTHIYIYTYIYIS